MLRALVEMTAELDRDLPITAALVFLAVGRAGKAGLDQGQMQDELELSSSTTSRTVQSLGKTHYLKGRDGLDLVEREFDKTDNRKRVLRLTAKGERVMANILKALEKP